MAEPERVVDTYDDDGSSDDGPEVIVDTFPTDEQTIQFECERKEVRHSLGGINSV